MLLEADSRTHVDPKKHVLEWGLSLLEKVHFWGGLCQHILTYGTYAATRAVWVQIYLIKDFATVPAQRTK